MVGKNLCRASLIETLEGRQLMSATLFVQHNLVSDGAVPADHIDKNLVNPWGVSADDTAGAAWVSDNGTGLSTLYDFGTGSPVPLVVRIPGRNGPGAPTGQAFLKQGTNFNFSSGGKSGAAVFVFASEDGVISAWNPAVSLNNAVVTYTGSANSLYKGLAAATVGGVPYLYAANFGTGQVDVFDTHFHRVTEFGKFLDPTVPNGFTPFNVQNVDGKLFVTYAARATGAHDETHGAGLGYVAEFNAGGRLIRHYQHTAAMNAPWGVSRAPRTFGAFAGDVLVGQFGSGEILAFNHKTGKLDGTLDGANGKPIVISGLWP